MGVGVGGGWGGVEEGEQTRGGNGQHWTEAEREGLDII